MKHLTLARIGLFFAVLNLLTAVYQRNAHAGSGWMTAVVLLLTVMNLTRTIEDLRAGNEALRRIVYAWRGDQ